MNRQIEQTFVETFIIDKLRERFLFELCGKKREKALSRLSHNIEDVIENKYMIKIDTQEELINKLRSFGNDSQNYYYRPNYYLCVVDNREYRSIFAYRTQ